MQTLAVRWAGAAVMAACAGCGEVETPDGPPPTGASGASPSAGARGVGATAAGRSPDVPADFVPGSRQYGGGSFAAQLPPGRWDLAAALSTGEVGVARNVAVAAGEHLVHDIRIGEQTVLLGRVTDALSG